MKAWTREELLLAINLYCKTPFGRIHYRNPDIIRLAELLGRTPGSVSYKLANFASIDPSLDRRGAANVSRLDREVWDEFFADWDAMAFESEQELARLSGKTSLPDTEVDEFPVGTSKEVVRRVRVNQDFFRRTILASYDFKCCITHLPITDLLIASHIVPWSVDKENRTNPRNGLCLNALHDKAFDKGYMTLDESFRVVISRQLVDSRDESIADFRKIEGKQISLPKRFIPDQSFLDYHRNTVFKA